jgi:hypothetical protein
MSIAHNPVPGRCPLGAIWIGLGLFLAIVTGCQTTSPSGAKVSASIIITNASVGDITVATMDVFAKAGYTPKSATAKTVLLEKPGGTMNNLLHSDWSGKGTVERVRIRILEYPSNAHLVECDAVIVSHPDEFVMEEEKHVLGTGQFQTLLEKVKARFK